MSSSRCRRFPQQITQHALPPSTGTFVTTLCKWVVCDWRLPSAAARIVHACLVAVVIDLVAPCLIASLLRNWLPLGFNWSAIIWMRLPIYDAVIQSCGLTAFDFPIRFWAGERRRRSLCFSWFIFYFDNMTTLCQIAEITHRRRMCHFSRMNESTLKGCFNRVTLSVHF